MSDLTHFDRSGQVQMVDVSEKQATVRRAVAVGFVVLSASVLKKIAERQGPKGDPLEIARIAGIMAAKRTSELIPLCHQIALAKADVRINATERGLEITAEASTTGPTGVEMEALTAVSVAALTIYDMCKAVQKDIVITDIRLQSKTGGRSDIPAG